jgi:hypothetical protein
VWYGSPQWQIEALWRFQIPESLRRKYAYPELTEKAKRKIIGLNNARLYGIKNTSGQLTDDETCERNGDDRRVGYHPVPTNYEALIPIALKRTLEFAGFAQDDRLSKMRKEYFAMGGLPSNTRYGWLRRG